MERKQYIRIEQIRRPSPLTKEDKEARIIAKAQEMKIKLGVPDGKNNNKQK